jgi:hypothetical protein
LQYYCAALLNRLPTPSSSLHENLAHILSFVRAG